VPIEESIREYWEYLRRQTDIDDILEYAEKTMMKKGVVRAVKKMKAFLLAAGKGTRLRPLTFHTPKCLVPICGKPLIEYWFDLFELYGINEVLINTSHLSEMVREYLNGHSRGLSITLTYEETLLGSGGTIKKNRPLLTGKNLFIFFMQTT